MKIHIINDNLDELVDHDNVYRHHLRFKIISGLKLFTTGSTVNLKHSKNDASLYTVQVGHCPCP